MATAIRSVGEKVVGVSSGRSSGPREAWWWNEEVQKKVKDKQALFKELLSVRPGEERTLKMVAYKVTKREAKKAVAKAKGEAYEEIECWAMKKQGYARRVNYSAVRAECIEYVVVKFPLGESHVNKVMGSVLFITKDTVIKGCELLKECDEMIGKLGLFSANEIKDDISNAKLKYLLKIAQEDRIQVLKASHAKLKEFISFYETMELVTEKELESSGRARGNTFADQRADKVDREYCT
ncbi:PP2A regulatory subunit [Orobanche hederae]